MAKPNSPDTAQLKPVFIISIPRSGSTLLQRILMTHQNISSIAEPWFLLPFVYSTRKAGTKSEYSHINANIGLTDLISNLENGISDYYKYLREFVIKIYTNVAAENAIYFIDKTPRYYLIISELADIFPDAKFIFLFRNPISVYASILNTWKNDIRLIGRFGIDLNTGFQLMQQGYDKVKDRSIVLHYESIVKNPKEEIEKTIHFLGLDYSDNLITDFLKQDLKGIGGDPKMNEYSAISDKNLDMWKTAINTRFRKKILVNYINSLDSESLEFIGYPKVTVLEMAKSHHIKNYKIKLKEIYRYYKFKAKMYRHGLNRKRSVAWHHSTHIE